MPGWSNLMPTFTASAAPPPVAPPPPLEPPGVPLPQAARPMAASAATVAALIRPSFILVFPPCCARAFGRDLGVRSVGEDLAKEVLGPVRLGVVEELLGRCVLEDLAVRHEHDPVRRPSREPHLVGHDDHRHARLRQLEHDVETSLIISGSSAEVGSSKSMTLGSIASDRAIATRCC